MRVQTPRENNLKLSHSFNSKKMISHTFTPALPLNHTFFLSLSLFIHEIRELPKECNHPGVNVQHVPDIFPLGWEDWDKLLSSSHSAHFYLCGDEDTQLRGAVPGDGEQRDATRRFPFSPSSLPRIKSCHHHFSFVIKDCLSASDGHLQLLMSANMEMIRRILTVTNFKCIVNCYQWVTVMTDNVHAFICREQKRRKHRTIWVCHLVFDAAAQ